MIDSNVENYPIHVPDAQIADLRRRLEAIRWPEAETVNDWSQGVPLQTMRDLVDAWTSHDWRECETWINASGSSRIWIDGLPIHFLHLRSAEPAATPLLLTHGWPGAILEFREIAQALTDPAHHGGSPADAFHLVIPSLPGFGFSGKPGKSGWTIAKIAGAWEILMDRLGYTRWLAQGGDWGAAITTELGVRAHPALAGIHVNMPLVMPSEPTPPFSADEQAMLDALAIYTAEEAGYSTQQGTRPQTLGYGLADSPVGQAAWIYEKFAAWSDCNGVPEDAIPRKAMLDIISLYWFTNSGASSGRLYWESFADGFGARDIAIPVGCSIFPRELYRAPRSWAERCMRELVHWNELPRGGHFAALEQPALFAAEMRQWASRLR